MNLKLVITFCIVFIAGIFLFQSFEGSHLLDKKDSKQLYPNDYWWQVRSNINGEFDGEKYLAAMEEVNKLKLDKGSSRGPLDNPWLLEGPFNIGGRINVLEHSITGDTMYAGAANGGVFRTTNAGGTWTSVFDNYSFMSVGAIEIDPNDASTIYIGTGDRNFGGGSYNGNGLYKSDDFGLTWSNLGLASAGIITDCSVNPTNSQNIVIGALGDGFAKTTDRGIFVSNDGGSTWINTLFVSDTSGVCDLIRDPVNPQILYAATFNRMNQFGNGISKGLDSKIFKSIDGGLTWNELTNGLPNGQEMSRVGLTLSTSNPNTIYSVYVGTDYNIFDVYKSTDAGANWTALNVNSGASGLDANALGGFGWYFGTIYVSPYDENTLIIPGVDMWLSQDGGLTWNRNVPEWWTYEVHADKHHVSFIDANTIVIATDGGLYKSDNLGISWTDFSDLPITQYYDITAVHHNTGVYGGGAQDNGTSTGNAISGSWNRDFGGDGFHAHFDRTTGLSIYQTQRGGIHVDNFGNIETLDFDSGERLPWFTAYDYKNGDSDMLVGSNRLLYFEVLAGGFLPEVLTGDLTMTGFGATTEERYHYISEIERKRFDEMNALIGTSDGLVWKTFTDTQSGNTTTAENIKGNLPDMFVTSVNHSLEDSLTYFVSMNGYYPTSTVPYIYKTTDGGTTWNSIAGDMPQIGVNDLLITEIQNDQVIFAATDAGVFITQNGGTNWVLVGTDLPSIDITEIDIDYDNNKLIAGTFGRSMWSYDISFLNLGEYTASLSEDTKTSIQLYPNPTTDFITIESDYLGEISIFDLSGKLVKKFNKNSNSQTFSISELRNAIYLMKAGDKVVRLVKN